MSLRGIRMWSLRKWIKEVDCWDCSRSYFSCIVISLRSNNIKFLLIAYSDYSSSKLAPHSIFFFYSSSSSDYYSCSWSYWLRVLAVLINLEWNSSNPCSEIYFLMLLVHFYRLSIPYTMLLMILIIRMFIFRVSWLDFCCSLNLIFEARRFNSFFTNDSLANRIIV